MHCAYAAKTRNASTETREAIFPEIHVSLAIPSETRRDEAICGLLVNFDDYFYK